MSLPAVGTRLVLNNSLGTVRYVGPVDGTQGVWLGVEWDDPARGMHDGTKDGKQYFSCVLPHSSCASFIRPSARHLSYGRSFLAALAEKYIDADLAAPRELVTLGSSHGLIHVEAVGLARVRAKLADLSRLREVSLDRAAIAWADPRPQIADTCPNIQGLDLSLSLLPSWPALAALTSQLPCLSRLALNSSRLALHPVPPPPLPNAPASPPPPLHAAFARLTDLQLNATLTPWPALLSLLPHLPSLHALEMGYNLLPALPCPPGTPAHPALALLNLDTNLLTTLPAALPAVFPNLTRLVLAANRIPRIETPEHAHALHGIKHLSLSANPLTDWASIDNLRAWCPHLEGLSIRDIPLLQDPHARTFAIAKIPTLTFLDGAPILPKDRLDAELFYLSYISQHVPPAEHSSWARYDELVQEHGRPDPPPRTARDPGHETLSSKLIQITLHLPSTSPTPLRILPTTPLRALRLRILKLLPSPKPLPAQLRLFVRGQVEMADERAVGWWLEEGDEVVVEIAE